MQADAWLHSALRGHRLAPWLLLAALAHAALLAPPPSAPWRPTAAPLPPTAVPLTLQGRLRPESQGPTSSVTSSATAPSPARPAAPAAASPTRPAPPPLPDPAEPAEPAPTLAWPDSGRWAYRLLWQGQPGEAWLDWRLEADAPEAPDARHALGGPGGPHGRYQLRLERRTAERALPVWLSEGRWSAQGLASERFAAQRGPRSWRRVSEGSPGDDSQDRLSWMVQLPALLQARPGVRALVLRVRDWRGQAQDWAFERQADETLTLADGQPRRAQHWRRLPQGDAQAEIALWLDPSDGHRLLRAVHRLRGDERWELLWNPADFGVQGPEGVINPPHPAADKAGEGPADSALMPRSSHASP